MSPLKQLPLILVLVGILWQKVTCLIFYFLFDLIYISPSGNPFSSFYYLCVNEGLVVSTCLGGAFVGSLFSGWIADGIGRRRAFQLCALPMVIGASVRYTYTFLKQSKCLFLSNSFIKHNFICLRLRATWSFLRGTGIYFFML